ncbi:hypothetical protein [Halorubrum trueperi]|uniref:DUF8113 domain-containing protein n=1 Tax=Halorubrum trueperi TaxID=2004704 RepID=A0ABD5UMG0_9EURY
MSDDDASDGATSGDQTTASGDQTTASGDASGDEFSAEIGRARALLDGDDIDAFHVGVVRDGKVDTAFAQRGDEGPDGEGLRALALLAAHVRLVASEAGVDPSTVAGDAATLAGQVERIPASTEDLPDE